MKDLTEQMLGIVDSMTVLEMLDAYHANKLPAHITVRTMLDMVHARAKKDAANPKPKRKRS